MKTLTTVTLNLSTNPDKWVTKCYADGQLVTKHESTSGPDANQYAADWLSTANDNPDLIENN